MCVRVILAVGFELRIVRPLREVFAEGAVVVMHKRKKCPLLERFAKSVLGCREVIISVTKGLKEAANKSGIFRKSANHQ